MCRIYDSERQEFVPCNNCTLSSYTRYNVTFVCKDISNLCEVSPASRRRLEAWDRYLNHLNTMSEGSEGERMRGGVSGKRILTVDDDYFAEDSTSLGSGLSARQFGALLESAAVSFVSIASSNPFSVNLEEAKTTISFVGALLVIFFLGAMLLSRWDRFDRAQFIYGNLWPTKTLASSSISKWLRRFQSADTTNNSRTTSRIKSKTLGSEFHRRNRSKYLFSVDLDDFLNLAIPEIFYYRKWIAIVIAVAQRHDFTSFLFLPFSEKSRFLQWMDLYNSVLNGLFISTLFFGIFYSNTGRCESYSNEVDCLSSENSITAQSVCVWGPSSDDEFSSESCSLNPPPANVSFVVILALVCVLIGAPMQIAVSFVLDNYCCQRPRLEDLGLSSERWLGTGVKKTELSTQSEKVSPLLQSSADRSQNPKWKQQTALPSSVDQKKGALVRSLSQYVVSDRFQDRMENASTIPSAGDTHDSRDQLSRAYYGLLSTDEEGTDCLMLSKGHFKMDFSSLSSFEKAEVDEWLKTYHATSHQIARFIGLQANLSFRSLSLRERLLYSSPLHKFYRKLAKARQRSAELAEAMEEVETIHEQLPEVYLLYHFVLEQLTPFKRWIIRDQLLCFQAFFPSTIDVTSWLLGWTFVIGVYLFYCYWIFAWGVANGALLLSEWGLNFAIGAIQDILFVIIAKIAICYVIALVSIRPQLVEIKQLLKVLALSAKNRDCDRLQIQRERVKEALRCHSQERVQPEVDSLPVDVKVAAVDFSVVQRLSPTCRVAWRNRFQHLFMSALLRRVEDYDIIRLQRSARRSTGLGGVLIVFVPITLTVLGAFFAEFLLDIVLPIVSSGFIVASYFLYTIDVAYLVIPWLVILLSLIWYYGIVRKATRFQLSEDKQLSKSATELMPTTTLVRRNKRSLFLEIRRLFISATDSISLLIAATSSEYRKEMRKRSELREAWLWRNMNLPKDLYPSLPIPVTDSKRKLTSRKSSLLLREVYRNQSTNDSFRNHSRETQDMVATMSPSQTVHSEGLDPPETSDSDEDEFSFADFDNNSDNDETRREVRLPRSIAAMTFGEIGRKRNFNSKGVGGHSLLDGKHSRQNEAAEEKWTEAGKLASDVHSERLETKRASEGIRSEEGYHSWKLRELSVEIEGKTVTTHGRTLAESQHQRRTVTLQHFSSRDYMQELLREKCLNFYPWDDYVFYQACQHRLDSVSTHLSRRPGPTPSSEYIRRHFRVNSPIAALQHMILLYLEQSLPGKDLVELQEMATLVMVRGWAMLILKEDLLRLFEHVWHFYRPNNRRLGLVERRELSEELQRFLNQNYFLSPYINFFYFTEWFQEVHRNRLKSGR